MARISLADISTTVFWDCWLANLKNFVLCDSYSSWAIIWVLVRCFIPISWLGLGPRNLFCFSEADTAYFTSYWVCGLTVRWPPSSTSTSYTYVFLIRETQGFFSFYMKLSALSANLYISSVSFLFSRLVSIISLKVFELRISFDLNKVSSSVVESYADESLLSSMIVVPTAFGKSDFLYLIRVTGISP